MKSTLRWIFMLVGAGIMLPSGVMGQATCPGGAQHCAQLSWTVPTTGTPPTGYNVYRTTAGRNGCQVVRAATCLKAGSVQVPTTQFMDSPLSPSTQYWWVVTSKNANGESQPSLPATGTTGANPPQISPNPTRAALIIEVRYEHSLL